MMRCRIALVVWPALVFSAGCADSAQDEAARTADALRAATAQLRLDVRSTLDEFGAQMERLDQQYMSATDDVAATWLDARAGIREYSEGIEADLAQLETATEEEAQRLKGEIAEDLEQLTERVERAQLESFENGEEFVLASRDRLARLGGDFQALNDEVAALSTEARADASDELEALHTRADELELQLDGLADATAEEIAEHRTEIAQAISALTASVGRELFEMRQAVTE
jgi:hypothetical protein